MDTPGFMCRPFFGGLIVTFTITFTHSLMEAHGQSFKVSCLLIFSEMQSRRMMASGLTFKYGCLLNMDGRPGFNDTRHASFKKKKK